MISNTHTHAHTHTPTGTLSGLNSTAATLWYVTTERMALPLEAVPVGALCLVASAWVPDRAPVVVPLVVVVEVAAATVCSPLRPNQTNNSFL